MSKKLKGYTIVTRETCTVSYFIEATSEEDALVRFHDGKSGAGQIDESYVDEVVEVIEEDKIKESQVF